MLDETVLEQRLTTLERAVVDLQRQVAITQASNGNWILKVIGSITDEEAFLEALAYGREFRHADRPKDEPGETP